MALSVLELALIAMAACLGIVLLWTIWGVYRQRRREISDAQRLQDSIEAGLNLPTSLHPIIDPDLCSGCLSCLDVCPEGDLFGVRDGKAVMIEAARCIGHGVCVDACPTGAISLVFGSEQRGVDLPETDPFFETARPGVHVIGELGGMGLIKNALKQGLDVARVLAERMDGRGTAEKDIAIIGAGPAGVATAIGCRAIGLSFRIIDQNTVGGTIASFHRQKLVMTEPVKLPLYGYFG
jgi:NAD-dependent dihydropyrimidine dehydrogenase PreA subunit